MSESVTLADIERLCWRLSGWTVEQESVDRLLTAVTAYAGCAAVPGATGPGGAPGRWQGASAGLAVVDETQAAVESPEGAPEAPGEPLAGDRAPEGAQEREEGVQRLHLTGTLTLVCQGACPPVKPAASKRRKPRARKAPGAGSAVPEDTRACRKCGVVHAITEYTRDTRGLRGRKAVCRECENRRKRDARREARKQQQAA